MTELFWFLFACGTIVVVAVITWFLVIVSDQMKEIRQNKRIDDLMKGRRK